MYSYIFSRIDGLKSGPFDLGAYDNALPHSWQHVAQPAIESRMSQFGAAETHFALLRICQKRSSALESLLSSLNEQQDDTRMDVSTTETSTMSQQQIARYRELLQDERAKEQRYAAENVRRRHNYVPFIVELLHTLGRAGKLDVLVDNATAKQQAQGNQNESS